MAINDPRQLRDKVYYKVSYKNVKILHHSKAGTYAIKLISVKNYNSIAILEFYILNLELPYRHSHLIILIWDTQKCTHSFKTKPNETSKKLSRNRYSCFNQRDEIPLGSSAKACCTIKSILTILNETRQARFASPMVKQRSTTSWLSPLPHQI